MVLTHNGINSYEIQKRGLPVIVVSLTFKTGTPMITFITIAAVLFFLDDD